MVSNMRTTGQNRPSNVFTLENVKEGIKFGHYKHIHYIKLNVFFTNFYRNVHFYYGFTVINESVNSQKMLIFFF